MKRLLYGVLVVVAVPTAGARAGGVVYEWLNAAGGPFNVNTNWNPPVVPGALDSAVFGIDLAYTVTFPSAAGSELITVAEGQVTFNLSSFTYTTSGVIIGDDPARIGRLTLSGGTLSVVPIVPPLSVEIGKCPGSVGELVVASGAAFSCTDDLSVGKGGLGTLTVSGGSATTANSFVGDDEDSEGTVTVTGATSLLTVNGSLILGNHGPGELDILLGGDVDCLGLVRLGDAALTAGDVTVDGAGSTWSCGQPLRVGNFGSGSLAFSGGATIDSARVNLGQEIGAMGSATVSGATTTWTDSVQITVARGGTAALAISGGSSVIGVDGTLGDQPGSSGIATVSGAGSSWTSSSELIIGHLGTGALTVSGGGFVSGFDTSIGHTGTGTLDVTTGGSAAFPGLVRIGDLAGSDGAVTIDGPGSTGAFQAALFVGNFGTGTITVSGGATVTTVSSFTGDDPMSSGTITVQGAGSTWMESGAPFLGNAGSGHLDVLAGGDVTWAGLSRLGDDLGSEGAVTVAGAGSSWTVQSEMFVGNCGTGTVSVTGGGAMSTARVKLGDEPGSSGAVTVTGPGSMWTDTVEIFVGNFGAGGLTVSAGGTVGGAVGVLGDDPGSSGTALVTGPNSTWSSSTSLAVGDLGQGELTVANGGVVSAPAITVNAQSRVEGDGTLTGAVSSAGTVAPGLSVGQLSVQGPYTQSGSGHLEIELGCEGGDRLIVQGAAQLAGALDLSFVAGSAPQAGQEFVILTASSVSGAFSPVNAPGAVQVFYDAGAVRVVSVDGAPLSQGDFNGDGNVGFSDLNVVLSAWGPCPAPCPPDFNNDNNVGFSDLNVILGSWGSVCP